MGFDVDSAVIPVFAKRFGSWHLNIGRVAHEPDALAKRYDQVAGRWEKILARIDAPGAYGRILAEAVVHIGGTGPDRALDCGTGTGAMSEALGRIAPGRFRQEAMDLSPHMLAAARRRFRKIGLRVGLARGDMAGLPYEADRFALTIAAHVIEHQADRQAAIQEMIRVTRPGGVVLVLLTRRGLLGRLIQLRWRTHLIGKKGGLRLLAKAGLQDVRALPIPGQAGVARRSLALLGRVPGA